ncbi:uncharacterized protein JCM15063_001682 [Sporobolomyces koalae]|uniref:uncharacterized protein n=1 Tax=Sporobolomyces koalae TaxID=500713 RepID=UPI003179DB58
MGLTRVVTLTSLMLASTILASFAPLYLNLSRRSVQLVSTYSTGLLVGAALTVVIPEGVAAVFASIPASAHDDSAAGAIGASLLGGFILMYVIDSIHSHSESDRPHLHPPVHSRDHPSLRHMPSHLSELEPLSATSHDPHASPSEWTVPMSPPSPPISSSSSPARADQSSVSTLIGLLLHSLADGISLGASSSSNETDTLSTLVFVAIMLHKAPTAFALSSLLASNPRNSTAFVRKGLLAFSLAAPIGAILTYLVLHLGQGSDSQDATAWYTGIALVFSGGTFLFVATHAITESSDDQHDSEGGAHKLSKRTKVGLVLCGMVTPAILSRLVGHGH